MTQVLHSNIYPGQLVPAGQTISIFEVKDSLDESIILRGELDRLYEEGLTWKITFASIFGER